MSEQASGRASGPVLKFRLMAALNFSALLMDKDKKLGRQGYHSPLFSLLPALHCSSLPIKNPISPKSLSSALYSSSSYCFSFLFTLSSSEFTPLPPSSIAVTFPAHSPIQDNECCIWRLIATKQTKADRHESRPRNFISHHVS